jgi:hypothetical protein
MVGVAMKSTMACGSSSLSLADGMPHGPARESADGRITRFTLKSDFSSPTTKPHFRNNTHQIALRILYMQKQA